MAEKQIEGRFGDMQVASDSNDFVAAIPSNALTVVIYTQYKFPLWYSFDGTVNSWEKKMFHTQEGKSSINIPSGATDIYIRKPVQPRANSSLSADPDLVNFFGSERKAIASDIFAYIDLEFRQ